MSPLLGTAMRPLVMLIRHAEKPRAGERAIDRRGLPDERSLSVTGWMRAGALVRGFCMAQPPLLRPRHLIAAAATAENPSTRPLDTLCALSEAIEQPIDERWQSEDDPQVLATHLLGLAAPVLVCWRHDALPALARALLKGGQAAPEDWPVSCYDQIWLIAPGAGGSTFESVPQGLLPGDRLPHRLVPC